mmetsp:Transcript_11320/g.35205  ORF Transcript_11320/g.35205 Transcript_11320/m.35205 type:complete len:229 (+) Transcript_11320:994-1680(+)
MRGGWPSGRSDGARTAVATAASQARQPLHVGCGAGELRLEPRDGDAAAVQLLLHRLPRFVEFELQGAEVALSAREGPRTAIAAGLQPGDALLPQSRLRRRRPRAERTAGEGDAARKGDRLKRAAARRVAAAGLPRELARHGLDTGKRFGTLRRCGGREVLVFRLQRRVVCPRLVEFQRRFLVVRRRLKRGRHVRRLFERPRLVHNQLLPEPAALVAELVDLVRRRHVP